MFIGKTFIDTIRNWKKTILLEINDMNQQHLLPSYDINYDMHWKIRIQICKVMEGLI